MEAVMMANRRCSVGVLTHSLKVEAGLPAQLLLSQARVSIAGRYISSPPRGDLVGDLRRAHSVGVLENVRWFKLKKREPLWISGQTSQQSAGVSQIST